MIRHGRPAAAPDGRRPARVPAVALRAAAALLLATGLNGSAVAAPAPDAVVAAVPAAGRPFAASSPFNLPIKAHPALDPNSAAMVARASRAGMVHANLFEYAIPIYQAGSRTPRHAVACTGPASWGSCPLEAGPLPIPPGAAANKGSDGAMAVVDPGTNTVSEYWQAVRSDSGAWSATWGAINTLSGSGWGGSSTGAGASRIGGVVRVAEVQAGVIDHALVMQSDNVCRQVYRAPALKTDGDSVRPDCIPEGARLQLDPGIDVASIRGITPGEKAVAKALQLYGAYVIDRGGGPLGISFELAPDAGWGTPGSAYTAAGLAWDYYGMPKVPWSKLRVLASWNG